MPLRLSPLLLSLAGLLALAPSAQAIVSTTAPGNWLATDDSLDAVARLTIGGGGGCSGSLLAGGAYVLTAAHCVTNGSGTVNASSIAVSFDGGRVTASVSQATQISVYSGWNGTLGLNNDLALLKLDTAVTSISGYTVATVSQLSATVLLAGYGYTGLGGTGYVSGTFGTLHWGANQYEETYGTASGSLLYDFDSGSAANNVFGSTGLGKFEALIAPGDSGGPSFVQLANGSLVLAGVHSFGARLNNGRYDIDRALDGSYGELGGDTGLWQPATLSWLAQAAPLATASMVPEPASAALIGVGGLMLAGWGRRRG